MPYRRLPKTDAARLRALKTVLDSNDLYTVRNRFVDWQTINRAQPAYDRLLTASEQYRLACSARVRGVGRIDKLQRNASMYVSHFLQVLMMAVERGEIKKAALKLYGLAEDTSTLPNIKTAEGLLHWGRLAVEGEKARVKQGGRPIYNPTVGMVSTHVDEIILELWNQIEAHFKDEPPETRFDMCRKFGVVYYYRKNENKVLEEKGEKE